MFLCEANHRGTCDSAAQDSVPAEKGCVNQSNGERSALIKNMKKELH